MAQFLMRRRRFLAGFVALGAISPAALAQSKPSCEVRDFVRDGKVLGTEAGYYWDSLGKEAFQRSAIAVNSSEVETSSCIDSRAVESTIRFVQEIREGGVVDTLSATVQSVDESLYRVPTELRMEAQFAANDLATPVPLASSRYENRAQLRPDIQLFGRLTGPLTLRVSTKTNTTPDQPDMIFRFSAAELNRAWAKAREASLIARDRVNAKSCAVRGYSPPGGSCFLTTAAVETIGLADDCWELTALRAFRDDWLSTQSGGAEDIALYEREAPAIAERLRADPRRLTRMYFTGILPSAIAARMGLNRLARSIYSHHMRRLAPLAAPQAA
ncbi:MAG: CFI-box-CTERM domain-containing protein [Pseudomonadota bacterium]